MSNIDTELSGLIEPGRVHRRLYTDPAIFELEMERIFGAAWLYVGHESQIKKPGDYFATRMGRKPVVLVHQNDRLASHARGEIVAGLFDLALVPDIEPGGAEDAFHLELEDGGIGVEPTVHATGRDQASKLGIDVAHRLIPAGELATSLVPFVADRALFQMIAHTARRPQALLRS